MAAAPSIGRASAVESPPPAPEADFTRDLYERYAGQIYGYCLHKLGSREEAEDAVQNTFLNAFRGLRRGVVPQAESAWLFKIAENVCLSRHRSSFRRGRVETPSDLQAIQDVTPSPERREDDLIGLEEALARMPESQRRAILLREWQGLSYREISQEMDLSQAAVETLIFRARRTLAQGLEDEPKTRRWKRVRQGADVGSVVALLKTLFTTGATVKAVATAVAVGSAVVAASSGELAAHRHHASHARPVTATHGSPVDLLDAVRPRSRCAEDGGHGWRAREDQAGRVRDAVEHRGLGHLHSRRGRLSGRDPAGDGRAARCDSGGARRDPDPDPAGGHAAPGRRASACGTGCRAARGPPTTPAHGLQVGNRHDHPRPARAGPPRGAHTRRPRRASSRRRPTRPRRRSPPRPS